MPRVLKPEQCEQHIRAFYELGEQVRQRAGSDGLTQSAAAGAIAQDASHSRDTAIKAARFVAKCTKDQLEKICELCHVGKRPISVNHIRRVLALHKREERLKLLKQAAAEGWSAARLGKEMSQASGGTTGRGGPRIRPPKDLNDLLEKIESLTNDWLNRYDEIWTHDENWPPWLGIGKGDTAALCKRLSQLRLEFTRLAHASKSLDERAQQVEEIVHNMQRKGSTSEPTGAGRKRSGRGTR